MYDGLMLPYFYRVVIEKELLKKVLLYYFVCTTIVFYDWVGLSFGTCTSRPCP